jgi:hypothetical protein
MYQLRCRLKTVLFGSLTALVMAFAFTGCKDQKLDLSDSAVNKIRNVMDADPMEWRAILLQVSEEKTKALPDYVNSFLGKYSIEPQSTHPFMIMNELSIHMDEKANRELEKVLRLGSDSVRIISISKSPQLVNKEINTTDVDNLIVAYILEHIISEKSKNSKAYGFTIQALLGGVKRKDNITHQAGMNKIDSVRAEKKRE